MNAKLALIVTGIAAALLIDLNSFVAARKTDPGAKYDFGLAIARAFQGLLVGLGGGLIPTE